MTSAKYYSNWMKEAGRGHLTFLLSGGGFLIYLCSMLVSLQIDTEYTFFGIGNGTGVFWLCVGLGLIIGFSEFFYLLQERKQEFYYSLPVKKSTIFWTRYVHGVVGGLFPILIYMLTCGIYQGSIDEIFLPYSVGYTMRSIWVYGLVYLMFYHIAVFAVIVCGRIVSTVFTIAMILSFSYVFIQNICLVFAKNLYQTFYRIPLLEQAETLFVPCKLGMELTGGSVFFEKENVLAFVPDKITLLAGHFWIVVLLGACIFMQKKRKTEAIGKFWVTVGIGRLAEFLLSVLTGMWIGALVLDIGEIGEKGFWTAVFVMVAVSGLASFLVHVLIEKLIFRQKGTRKNRNIQMVLEIATVSLGILGLAAIGPSFDAFLPEQEDVEQIGLCMYGLNMDNTEYIKCMRGRDSYRIEKQMERYEMSEDGLSAGIEWLHQIRIENIEKKQQYTTVTVCFQMKDGTEKYRTYPVDKTDLGKFADVFESEEYKALAYPVWEREDIQENRFTWSDGVTKQMMKLSGEEKEAFSDIYRRDIAVLKMSDLQTAPPVGTIEIKSEKWGETNQVIVYPFFENTCAFLKEHGIEVGRNLFDYPIRSIQVTEILFSTPQYSVGGTIMHFCKETEEIAAWKDRLVPEVFDQQPLLYPLDYSIDAKVEIEEPESGAIVTVKCKGIVDSK